VNAQETEIRKSRVSGYFATAPPQPVCLEINNIFNFKDMDFFSDDRVQTDLALEV
jgi:hypothetical protein